MAESGFLGLVSIIVVAGSGTERGIAGVSGIVNYEIVAIEKLVGFIYLKLKSFI